MMPSSMFYSWQSDLPNNTNRGFIESVLEAVCKKTLNHLGEKVLCVDRDTQGLPGSPDISAALLAKIDAASIMVADVSIVLKGTPVKLGEEEPALAAPERSTPNPNVLFELGYALKTLSWDRVVLFFNEASGSISDLPFDLKQKRVFPYRLVPGQEKADIRARLVETMRKHVEQALLPALQIQAPDEIRPIERLEKRLESGGSGLEALVHALWEGVLAEVQQTIPWGTEPFHKGEFSYEDFRSSLTCLEPVIEDFSRACSLCASHGHSDGLRELYRGFADLVRLCQSPSGYSGQVRSESADIFRFLTHEMLVTLVAAVLKYEKMWPLLGELLPEQWGRDRQGRPLDYLSVCCEYLYSLQAQQMALELIDLRAEILSERHGKDGPLARACPLADFQAAEFFLLWYSMNHPGSHPLHTEWVAWSCRFADFLPNYVTRASSKAYAARLAGALGLEDPEQLVDSLRKANERFGQMFPGNFGRAPGMHWQIRQSELLTRRT